MHEIRRLNPELPVQAFTDVVRWKLLGKYGGFWADATLYCNKSLDSWLPSDPVFLFRCEDTSLFNSWAIYGSPDSLIVKSMNEELQTYMVRYGGFLHYMNIMGFWRIYKYLEHKLGEKNYSFWRSFFVRKYLKASPYFFQNYLLGYILKDSSDVRDEFIAIPNTYKNSGHVLQEKTEKIGYLETSDIEMILASSIPLFKLTNKRYSSEWKKCGLLARLDAHD